MTDPIKQAGKRTAMMIQDRIDCGQPVPDYLRRQSEAIALLETDPRRGLSALVEALRDESDALDKIEVPHG